MKNLAAAIANRADDSYIVDNDCILVGDIRRLINENRALSEANAAFCARTLEGRELNLVPAPGKRPAVAW